MDTQEVVIGGNSYSMAVEPAATSSIVLAEKELLLGSLNLESLVKDLGRVGNFIRVIYNGIRAGGEHFQDLEIEVLSLGHDITRLCDKSAVTIAHFKSAAKTVLVELKATYQFLLDGLEEMGVDTLSTLSTVAGKMATAAEELQKEFEKEEAKVVSVLENAQQREKLETSRIEDDRARLEAEKKIQEDLIKKYAKLEEEARERDKNEDKELSSSGFFENLRNPFTSEVGLGESDEKVTGQNNRWAQINLQKLEIEKEQRKLHFNALQKIAKFAYQLQGLDKENGSTKVAIDALYEAASAIKRLSLIMWQIALFLYQIQQHCLNLPDTSVQERIMEFASKYPPERRLAYWTSNGFKQQMMQFYAKWVAFRSVNDEYLQQIKLTQKDLYQYITGKPASEDNPKALAAALLDDVKEAQDQLKVEDAVTDKKERQPWMPQIDRHK